MSEQEHHRASTPENFGARALDGYPIPTRVELSGPVNCNNPMARQTQAVAPLQGLLCRPPKSARSKPTSSPHAIFYHSAFGKIQNTDVISRSTCDAIQRQICET